MTDYFADRRKGGTSSAIQPNTTNTSTNTNTNTNVNTSGGTDFFADRKKTSTPQVTTSASTNASKSVSIPTVSPSDKWTKYADPSYKLSSEEKKEVKSAYKELKKMGIERNTYNEREKWDKAVQNGEVDMDYVNKVRDAYDKSSVEGAVFSFIEGLGSSLAKPVTATMALGETIGNKITGNDKSNWNDANNSREDAYEHSSKLNPLATGAGNLAGNVLMYQAANGILGEGTNVAQNLAKGQAVDTVLDTIPTIGNDALRGKYTDEDGSTNWKELVKDAIVNEAWNFGFNAIPEVASAGIKKLINSKNAKEALKVADDLTDEDWEELARILKESNAKRAAQTATENADDIIKSATNNTDDIIKSATNNADDIIKNTASNADDVIKNVPSNVDSVIKNADDVNPVGKPNTEVGDARHIGDKVSQVRKNTLENSGLLSDEELKSIYFDESVFTYDSTTEKESITNAIRRIASDPNGTYENIMNKEAINASNEDIDSLFIYFRTLTEEARSAKADGLIKESEELWNQASETFKKIQEIGSAKGRDLQAYAKWSRNTKEGMLSEVLRTTERNVKDKFGEKIAKDVIDRLSKDKIEEIQDIIDKVAEMDDINSREAKLELAKIGKIVDKYTPKKISNQITTILMDNMLGNFRTLISRNAGGNLGYNAMEQLRQPITALADKLVSLKTGKRTRTGWSTAKMSAYFNGMRKGVTEEVDDLLKNVHTAKSAENTIENAIGLNQHAWSTNHQTSSEAFNKFMDFSGSVANKIDDLVKHGLSAGDRPFYEAAYAQRMAELNDLYSKGLLGEAVQSLDEKQFKKLAEISAQLDGLTATYQNKGAWSDALAGIKKAIARASEGTVGIDIMSQFATPFVRTPGNIIERSIEYSPLGFIKSGLEVARDRSKGLDFNQQRFVDEFGRSVLGTAGLGGAIALYNNGVTNGSYSKSKPVKQAQQDNGMIEYGVNLPIGENGANVDLSFMPVVGTLLTEGAAIGENKKANPDASGLDNLVAGSSALINTLIDASAMQGLQRLVGGSNSYSSEGLAQNIKNTFESGLGQLEPSWLRQVASVSDDYQRSVANGDRDYAMNNLISGIPALRENKLEPKVSGEGELILQNQGRGLGSKIFENMVLPGKYSEYKQSDIRDEQMRLSETTTETKQFGGNPSRSDITSDTFTPTDKSFREYSQIYKQTTTEIENALLNTSYYKNLDDADRVELLSKVDSASKSYAREKILGSLSSKNTLAEEYKKGGTQGVINYLEKKNAFDSYDYNMSNKKANTVYEKYGEYGLGVLSQITNGADKDQNGSVNSAELIEYLDGVSMSQADKQYWYGIISNTKNNPYDPDSQTSKKFNR